MNAIARVLLELAQGRRSPTYYTGWSWGTHPVVDARINRCVSGDPRVDVYQYLKQAYGHRIKTVLDLGCGSGTILKDFLDRGIGSHYTGIDVSEVGVKRARGLLPPDRSRFIAADLNTCDLTGQYDLVMFWYALHHIDNLEHILGRVPPLLGEDGLLFVYDYFGPNRMQWTDTQMRFARGYLDQMPKRFRHYHANSVAKLFYYVISGQVVWRPDGMLRKRVRRQPAWLIRLRDPSEAVRSADIYEVLKEKFEVVEEHATPGGIAQLILDNIVQNMQDEEGKRCVEHLLDFEEYATNAGLLPVMHRWMMLRRRV